VPSLNSQAKGVQGCLLGAVSVLQTPFAKCQVGESFISLAPASSKWWGKQKKRERKEEAEEGGRGQREIRAEPSL